MSANGGSPWWGNAFFPALHWLSFSLLGVLPEVGKWSGLVLGIMGAFFSGLSLGCMEPSGSMASTGSCCQLMVLRQVLRATGENLRFPFSSNSMSCNLSQLVYLGLQGCLLVRPFVPIPLSATRILSIETMCAMREHVMLNSEELREKPGSHTGWIYPIMLVILPPWGPAVCHFLTLFGPGVAAVVVSQADCLYRSPTKLEEWWWGKLRHLSSHLTSVHCLLLCLPPSWEIMLSALSWLV